jgi:hypothetical protein
MARPRRLAREIETPSRLSLFEGEPKAKEGFVDLADDVPGLGLTVNEKALEQFDVLE